MTKEYYELRNNRIDSENWENIKMELEEDEMSNGIQ